jgi:hypothetical protein
VLVIQMPEAGINHHTNGDNYKRKHFRSRLQVRDPPENGKHIGLLFQPGRHNAIKVPGDRIPIGHLVVIGL